MSTPLSLNDCITLAQNGDRAALDRLTALIAPLIERQLLRYPLSDDDRCDAAQSALMQVVRRIGSFRGHASFTTWLFRVTANEALMMMRSQRRHRAHVAGEFDLDDIEGLCSGALSEEPTVDGSAIEQQREVAVRDAIEQLPEHYRDVVTAHYHDELGLHEIAHQRNVTESAVRSRLHRARSRLRTLLTATPRLREIATAA